MSFDWQVFEQAIAQRDAGHVDVALEILEKLRNRSELTGDECVSLLLNETTCLARLGRLSDARARLSMAATIAGPTVSSHYCFIDACLSIDEGRLQEGLEILNRLASELEAGGDPELFVDTQLRRGVLFYNLGSPERALDALRNLDTVNLSPADVQELSYYRGRSFCDLGRQEEAVGEFMIVVTVGSENQLTSDARYFLALLNAAKGAFAAAASFLENSVSGKTPPSVAGDQLAALRARIQHGLAKH